MPTGYTADIANGITFKQYALNCARAFGALVMMRDDPSDAPIPDRFEPSNYHSNAIAEARQRLAALESMTDIEIEEATQNAYEKEVAAHNKRLEEKAELRAKYEAMLEQVRAFTPPSPDHVKYKEFMEEQIVGSIDFDCSTEYMDEPKLLTSHEWYAKELGKANRDIAYHIAAHQEELDRTEERNKWIAQLKASLSENDAKS